MRNLVVAVVLGTGGVAAAAPPMTASGTVVEAKSHWTDEDTRIVTDVMIQTDSGLVVVRQLGGTVDGIGMIAMPGPPILEPGMVVTVQAEQRADQTSGAPMTLMAATVIATSPGFVRTGPTRAGNSLYWESGCAFVTADSAGTTAVAGDQEFAVIDASIETWNDSTASCAAPHLINEGKRAVEVNGRDMTNVIKFRDTSWSHQAGSAGITIVTYVNDGGDRDGAIVDADIELNGVNFAIAIAGQTLSRNRDIADLQNTLTHELGHLQGLEHTCLADGDPPRVDNRGLSVPACLPATDPEIAETTMYPFQTSGETKKSSLAADDIAAICAIFPKAKPGSCEPVGTGGGCCSASDGPGGPIVLAGLVGAFMLVRRRKNRHSGSREYAVPA